MNFLSIVPLNGENAEALSRLLNYDVNEYCRFFHPFPFDANTLQKVLSSLRDDRFWGVYCDDALIGFFMIRGMDAGFSVPSYGVYIAKGYSGKGVFRLTFQFVETWCKLNGIQKIMIKVHPENQTAKRSYEAFGAVPAGIDPNNNNLIYYQSIK